MKSKKGKKEIIEAEKEKILEYYISVAGIEPKEQAYDVVQTVKGPIHMWHLEPLLIDVPNVQLRWYTIGDSWICERVPIKKKIQSFGGI